MQQLQTVNTFGYTFALAKITDYRDRQAEHRDALGHLDDGIRHLDPGPGDYMMDTTDEYRQRHLAAIADPALLWHFQFRWFELSAAMRTSCQRCGKFEQMSENGAADLRQARPRWWR